jgi:hypothetical protein
MLDKLYMSVACKAAIKANNKNSALELAAWLILFFQMRSTNIVRMADLLI